MQLVLIYRFVVFMIVVIVVVVGGGHLRNRFVGKQTPQDFSSGNASSAVRKDAKTLQVSQILSNGGVQAFFIKGRLLEDARLNEWGGISGSLSILGDPQNSSVQYFIPKGTGSVSFSEAEKQSMVWKDIEVEKVLKKLKKGVIVELRSTPLKDSTLYLALQNVVREDRISSFDVVIETRAIGIMQP